MLTKGPHGLGKVVPSASRDRERSRRRARSTQAPADAAPDVTSEVGFWTANYAERLRSFPFIPYVPPNPGESHIKMLLCASRGPLTGGASAAAPFRYDAALAEAHDQEEDDP